MDRFRTMQSFVEVIRLGSFSEAAKILGLSRALISRHITDLEKQLGVRLLTRTTRRITLTEAGAEHFNFCQRIIKEIEEKETSLKRMQREPAGSLKILAPKSLTTLLWGMRSRVSRRLILISVLVSCSMTFRFGVMISSNADSMSRCIRRPFANRAWLPERLPICVGCCARRPNISSGRASHAVPRDLTRHQCLVHVNSDPSDRVWRLRDTTGLASVKVQGPFASNSVLVLRKAALEALGHRNLAGLLR